MKPLTPRIRMRFIKAGSFSFFGLDLEEAHDLTIAAHREPFVALPVGPGFAMRGLSILDAGAKDFHLVRESAGVGRRDGAHQVVDLERSFRPVDAPVLGLASAEIAAARKVLGTQYGRAGKKPGKTAYQHCFGSVGHLAEDLERDLVGADRHALLVGDAAGVRLGAHFTAARPRSFGSSEPCMLNAPFFAAESISSGSMRR